MKGKVSKIESSDEQKAGRRELKSEKVFHRLISWTDQTLQRLTGTKFDGHQRRADPDRDAIA